MGFIYIYSIWQKDLLNGPEENLQGMWTHYPEIIMMNPLGNNRLVLFLESNFIYFPHCLSYSWHALGSQQHKIMRNINTKCDVDNFIWNCFMVITKEIIANSSTWCKWAVSLSK